MSKLSQWKVCESPCTPSEAKRRWNEGRAAGAVGAVTSWGSGMSHRETLRLFWEADHPPPAELAPLAEELAEEDWEAHWREALRPFPAGESVVLAPVWDDTPERAGQIRLRIDPGMAFGAGDHPTTRLCVELLEGLAARGGLPAPVLDVGSGTGVLSLVAARLGADHVAALDIDPFCYACCRRNARLNKREDKVEPLLLSLDLLEGSYGLIMANVVTGQHEALAAELAARAAPGATLLLSGFDTALEKRVRAAISNFCKIDARIEEEGWVALTATALE